MIAVCFVSPIVTPIFKTIGEKLTYWILIKNLIFAIMLRIVALECSNVC